MAIIKNNLKIKNSNGSEDLLYPQTSWDKVEDLSAHTVDLTTNQVIDGQKDFEVTPRVKAEGTGGEDHNLPDRYIELNYIYINKQFVGTTTNNNYQFIDSEIIPDSTIEFEFSFSYENAGPGSEIGSGVSMGARDSFTSAVCSLSGYSSFPTGYFGFNNNQRFEAYLVQGDNLVSFRYDPNDDTKGIYTCINSSGTHTHTINRNYTYPNTIKSLYIGALHEGNNSTGNLIGKIYYVKIWKNKTLVRDYYPCLHENTIGLYDKVSNELFTNIGNGIGNFTAGEPIKDAYYNVLTNANFATVAFTGSYSDLSNRPTNLNQFTNGPGYVTSSYHDSTKANQSSVDEINAKIPSAASSSNQLADKAFVNSSIETSTATFKGTYDSIAEIEALTADDNDYAFYRHTDSAGNTLFDRYKYNGTSWLYEYTLNNSSFTAAQWSAINSGVSTGSWVDTTTTQTIDGQKDFEVVPRVKVTHQTHNLPSEYQEVEYLESTGTQYINSGLTIDNNKRLEIEYYKASAGDSNSQWIFGTRLGFANNAFGLNYYTNQNPAYKWANHDGVILSNFIDYRAKCIFDLVNLEITFIQQTTTTILIASGSVANDKNLYLFAKNDNGVANAFATIKLYSCQLFDNGTLVRNFVPCYRKVDNVAGLYDIVNDVFYINAGTGDFVLGPNVEPITYESLLTDASFSTVATTGSYTDLLNKPTIPTATNQLTNNSGFVTNSILAPYTMTSAVVQADGLLSFSFSGNVFSSTYNKWLGTFTMGNCFFMIPLYNLTQNTLYKTSGTFVYNSSGAVVTTTINYKVTSDNTLLVWSGNSEKTLASGYTAYISLLRLF